jgi:hypothetical protein
VAGPIALRRLDQPVATSIRRALQPYQRGKQVALAGAIWLVTANNASRGAGVFQETGLQRQAHY